MLQCVQGSRWRLTNRFVWKIQTEKRRRDSSITSTSIQINFGKLKFGSSFFRILYWISYWYIPGLWLWLDDWCYYHKARRLDSYSRSAFIKAAHSVNVHDVRVYRAWWCTTCHFKNMYIFGTRVHVHHVTTYMSISRAYSSSSSSPSDCTPVAS